MSRPEPTCSLPSCRRPAAFATSREAGTVVLCRAHRELLRQELAKCADASSRRLAGDLPQSPMGDSESPENERQARALAAVPEPDRAEVVAAIGPIGLLAPPEVALSESPIGDSESPANEAQARALAAVPEGVGA